MSPHNPAQSYGLPVVGIGLVTQLFLLNYGVHAVVPVLGNDKAVIINCD